MFQYLFFVTCLVLCSQVCNIQGSVQSPGGRWPWNKPVYKREQDSGQVSSNALERREYFPDDIGYGGFNGFDSFGGFGGFRGRPISKRDEVKVDAIVLGSRDGVTGEYEWNGYRPRTKREHENNKVNARSSISRYGPSGNAGTYRGSASK